MFMLTIVDKKLNFALSVLYVATTSYFVENGIKAKYEKNKAQVLGSKPEKTIEINEIKKTQTGLDGVIDRGMLKFINIEFEVTENVKMQVQADQFIINLIYAFGFRLVCLLWNQQNLGVELFLSALRLLMVHTLDNIKMDYWIIECSYTLMVSVIDKFPYIEEQQQTSGSSNLMYKVPMLTLYLSGMFFIILIFGKNNTIESLKMKIKIQDEIIQRIIKNNQNQPMVLLKLNEPNLQKIDFSDLSTTLTQNIMQEYGQCAPFTSLEKSLSKKIGISPQKILYDLVCFNKPAKKYFENKSLGSLMQNELKDKFNILDVQDKFRSIQITKKSMENHLEKNLHKILNQGSALIFQDIMKEKLNSNNGHHFKSFDQIQKIEKLAKMKNQAQEYSEFDTSQDMAFSSFDIQQISEDASSDDNKMYSNIKQQRFKKLSEYSMVLFDDIFKIDKNMVQQIQCVIIYDTFLLQFYEPFYELNTGSPAHNQEYQIDLLGEERPTQSLYVVDKNDGQSHFAINKSKHLIRSNLQLKPMPVLNIGVLQRGAFKNKHKKQDKKLLKLKNAEMLKFEEGSLRSKDMLQGSQSSTIKININQSESSPRSFHTEVNKTKKLNQMQDPYKKFENQNIHQRIEASELKNEQKEMALKFFKKKVSDLEKDLTNTKIFLNMIIHEIRNPINNINFAIDSGLNCIKKASTLLIKYEQDLLKDSILYQQVNQAQEVPEINDFDEELMSEFNHPAPQRREMESDESKQMINNVPMIDPNSGIAFFKQKQGMIRDQRPERSQDQCYQLIIQSQSLQEQRNFLEPEQENAPPNSVRQEANEEANVCGQEIKDKIGKMSMDIDDQKNKFLLNLQSYENSQYDRGVQSNANQNESQFQLMDQSIKSNQGPRSNQNNLEEEKVAQSNRRVPSCRHNSSSSMNSMQSEKQLKKESDNVKSKFFAINQLGNEDELEDENSESLQCLKFQRNSGQNDKYNQDNFIQNLNEKIQEDNDDSIEEAINIKKYKNSPIKKDSDESYLKFSQNPSSFYDVQSQDNSIIQKSESIVIEKIQCPKFNLKSNYSPKQQEEQSKVYDSQMVREALNIPVLPFDQKSETSDSLDELIDNDLELPVGHLPNLHEQQRQNRPQNMPSSLKIKERIQKRKIELNQIKQCLNQAIEFMEGCEYSSNLTANLINDLLDFANTEKLCSKISKEWFNLGETIENAFNVLRFESKRKGIALKLSVPYNNLTSFNQIYSDESRFLQILLNLLSNSLKYTPNNGHIEVKLITCENIQMSDSFAFDLDLNDGELQKNQSININRYIKQMSICSGTNRSMKPGSQKNIFRPQIDPLDEYRQKFKNQYSYLKFKIQIIDNGVGIRQENLKNMFMDFNSLQENQKLNPRGKGLCLSMSKNLIEKMGGSIKVTSIRDKGTIFTVQMVEVQRIGEDKRELFNLQEEAQLEEMLIKLKYPMDQISERNSRSEDGIDSNPDKSLPQQMSLIKNLYQPNFKLNKSVKNRIDNQNGANLKNDSSGYINNLSKIKSMNSNEINLHSHHQKDPKNNRVLFEKTKKHQTMKKIELGYSEHDNESGSEYFKKENQHLKKQIEDHINQHKSKRSIPVARQSSNLAIIEDMSMSGSHDISISPSVNIQKGASKHLGNLLSDFQNLSILIANCDYQQILAIEQILNKYDIYDIAKAENGLIAYEKALQHKYDFIILDINMPIMDGIEAGRKIIDHYGKRGIMLNDPDRHSYGQSSGSSSRMPLIFGLSSYVNDQLIEDTKAIGFTDCLQAPFTIQKALDMLNHLIEDRIREKIEEAKITVQDHDQLPLEILMKKRNRASIQKFQSKSIEDQYLGNKSEGDSDYLVQIGEGFNAAFCQSSPKIENKINLKEKSTISAARVMPLQQRALNLSIKQQTYLESQSCIIKEEDDSESDE